MRILRVALEATFGGVVVANTFHLRTHTTAWTGDFTDEPTPEDVGGELVSNLVPKYAAILSDNTSFCHVSKISVRDEHDPLNPTRAGDAWESVLTTVGTRSTSDEKLPIPLCAMGQLRTGLSGRSFRGRMFFPPALNTASLASTRLFDVTNPYIVNAKAFLDELKATVSGGGSWTSLWQDTWEAKLIVYSRTRRAASLDDFANDVSSVAVPVTPHWLESRQS